MTSVLKRALLASLLLSIPAAAFAAAAGEVRQSFRSVADIALGKELVVPGIVSVSLPTGAAGSQAFGVYSISEGAFLPYEIRRSASRDVPVRVTGDGSGLQALVDGNYATVADFPLPLTGEAGRVTLRYSYDAPVTSDSLRMSLSQYVVRPVAVSIEARVGGETRVVLSRVRPDEDGISFPAFTSDAWTVTLEYAQPLRFAELSFENEAIVQESAALLFLGKPSHAYELYYNPEVILAQETGERPAFDAGGAAPASLARAGANQAYRPADSDKDSIIDLSDNCTRVANPGQEDVDGNGRGDACDDFDQDGIENAVDNCPDTPNRGQTDTDRDGAGDECDGVESRFTERYPWIVWGALALAFLVFAGLFYAALRQNGRARTDENLEIKDPVS